MIIRGFLGMLNKVALSDTKKRAYDPRVCDIHLGTKNEASFRMKLTLKDGKNPDLLDEALSQASSKDIPISGFSSWVR